MNGEKRNTVGARLSRWQNNCVDRHPAFFYIMIEFIAELLVASALALFAFHMLPPDLNFAVTQKATHESTLSITNDGFLFASGEFAIKSNKPILKDPVVRSGKKYVDKLERKSPSEFYLEVSGIPYRKEVKIDIESGHVTVDEV